jgi:hypothetical protein
VKRVVSRGANQTYSERLPMRTLFLGAVATTSLLCASLSFEGAQAAPPAQLSSGVFHASDAPSLQLAQFFFSGRNYCWYDGGWRGPGYYWCGYAWRRGFGWGGGVGWNGWHGGGHRGGGGFSGGGGRGAAGFAGGSRSGGVRGAAGFTGSRTAGVRSAAGSGGGLGGGGGGSGGHTGGGGGRGGGGGGQKHG